MAQPLRFRTRTQPHHPHRLQPVLPFLGKQKRFSDGSLKTFFLFNQFFREYGKDKEQTTMPLFPLSLFHHSYFHAVIPQKQKNQKQKPIIPAQAGIQFVRFQPFPINHRNVKFPNSHFRGNDGVNISKNSKKPNFHIRVNNGSDIFYFSSQN